MKVTSGATLVVGQERRDIPPGGVVDLPDAEAHDLIARGLVQEYDPSTAETEEPGAGSGPEPAGDGAEGDDQLDEIQAAILELDENDTSLWNADGKPKPGAISKELGRTVSAQERDEAWEKLEQE